MMTMTYNKRQGLSILLVLSMVFTMWMTVSPMNQANAGILSAVGSIARTLFVNVGGLAAGAMGAVVGAAVGGGPLGMAIGGVAGFCVGKKLLNWCTSSVANVATVAGAVAGGCLCAGMGFPMLAIGIVGGGVVSRLLVKGVGALIDRITNGKTITVSKSDVDEAAAKEESDAVAAFINGLQDDDTTVTTTVKKETPKVEEKNTSSSIKDSQAAYNTYTAAYQKYVDCAQKGDAEGAKAAMEEYRTNIKLYQALLKAGL